MTEVKGLWGTVAIAMIMNGSDYYYDDDDGELRAAVIMMILMIMVMLGNGIAIITMTIRER